MGGDDLYEEVDPTNSRGSGMAGLSDPSIQVMTCRTYLDRLFQAVSVPNYYNNHAPYNLGYYDGYKYSFDCWNLIKVVLAGWQPTGVVGSRTSPTVTGDVSGAVILDRCTERSRDFSKISVPGTYMYMYKGHAGTFIGDTEMNGQVVNVIECTSDWDHGVQYTYVSADGGRYKYKGGPGGTARGWTPWSEYGLLPYIDYSDVGHVAPPQVATGQLGPTGNEIYDLNGPVSNAEYIERRQLMDPRTTAPILTKSSRPIYEDDSTDATYQVQIGVDANGIMQYQTRYKKVKYDGRDMWYVPMEQGGWSPFPVIHNANYVWSRFSEAMDPDPNNLLIQHIPCNLSRGMAVDIYRCEEDGYVRNVAPAPGAVMCFYNKKKPRLGYVCIVEKMFENGTIITSEYNEKGQFQVVRRQKRYGFWDFDDYVFQGFIHNPACSIEADAESALETFCSVATEHVGSSISWIQEQTQLPLNDSASAALIVAVAKTAGSSLNIVIPNTTSVTGIGRIGTLQDMGIWINGPANGEAGQPAVGDIVIIRTQTYKKPSIYQGDAAGIITQVRANDSFTAVMVDRNIISDRTLRAHSSQIAGYFRPDWARIDGTSDSVKLYRNLHGLYTSGVEITDACAREMCYLGSNNLPSIKRTGIRLSAINYTGLLSNMYTVFATSSTSDAADTDLIVDLWTTTIKSWFQEGGIQLTADSANVIDEQEANNAESSYMSIGPDGLPLYTSGAELSGIVTVNSMYGSARTIYDILDAGTELNPAGICAVVANIRGEAGANFNCGAQGDYAWRCPQCGTENLKLNYPTTCRNCGGPKGTASEYPTAFGLCQWRGNRATNMKSYCIAHGGVWNGNLSGQVNFLIDEMRGRGLANVAGTEVDRYKGYGTEYNAMLQVPNNQAGMFEAVAIFVRSFERPGDPQGAISKRMEYATSYWSQLVQ